VAQLVSRVERFGADEWTLRSASDPRSGERLMDAAGAATVGVWVVKIMY
jgi:hypothetical protein